jgi:His-Xaa-Ser system protein HxsD
MTWCLSLDLDESVYSLPVVQRVAYALADKLTIQLSRRGQTLVLEISPSSTGTPTGQQEARDLLFRTLNDFTLREVIRQETRGFHELLARVALQESGAH